jgi:hypothetical protein
LKRKRRDAITSVSRNGGRRAPSDAAAAGIILSDIYAILATSIVAWGPSAGRPLRFRGL